VLVLAWSLALNALIFAALFGAAHLGWLREQ